MWVKLINWTSKFLFFFGTILLIFPSSLIKIPGNLITMILEEGKNILKIKLPPPGPSLMLIRIALCTFLIMLLTLSTTLQNI